MDHVPHLHDSTRYEHRPNPKASGQAAVAVNLGAGFRPGVDVWTVHADERSVRFNLRLAGRAPATFMLGVAVRLPTVGYSKILDDLWDFVEDKIKDRLKELIKEYYKRLEAGDPSADELARKIRDLKDYLDLHQSHLAHMLAAGDGMTLQEIISRSSKPVKAIPQVLLAEPVKVVEPVKEPPVVRLVKPAPPPLPKTKPAAGGGCLKFLLAIFLLTAAAVAVAGVSIYMGVIDANQVPWLQNFVQGNGGPQNLDDLLRAKGAKTGDVQVSLQWFNKNDLDLEVIAPSGEPVNFLNKVSRCGGELNVDMNEPLSRLSDRPVEHIVWPAGKAPKGRYQVFVTHFHRYDLPGCAYPTRYQVRVIIHGQPRHFDGELVHGDPNRSRKLVHVFDVP